MAGQGRPEEGSMKGHWMVKEGHIWANEWSRKGQRRSSIGQGRVTEWSMRGHRRPKEGPIRCQGCINEGP